MNLRTYMKTSMNDTSKQENSIRLSPRNTLRKLAIDRFVLTHFFLLFFVSFIIGVLFLHSTFTLWQFQTNEEALISTLESATHSFDLRNKAKPQIQEGVTWHDILTVTIPNNLSNHSLTR